MPLPFISICIPVYKNIAYLERLLYSIDLQNYRDFEVVITDDSPDDSIEKYLKNKKFTSQIKYFKNPIALGTPENWNESIRRSSGKWIKIMHDDDWFSTNDSLLKFYESTLNFPQASFHFSAFTNVDENTGYDQSVTCDFWDRIVLKFSPLNLFKRVYIGNPSCTLFLRETNIFFDNRFKFVVDFEFYIRFLKDYPDYAYIDLPLIKVGFNDQQVTKYTFNVRDVQIPENIVLLKKLGTGILKNVLVYDYFWRLLRNLSIREISEISDIFKGEIPFQLIGMIRLQKLLPISLLRIGLISKSFMAISYVRNLLASSF